MSDQNVLYSVVSPQVVVITINRPSVRNAVDGPTAASLADAFLRFENDDNLYVAILTGANSHFCAGADLKAFNNRMRDPRNESIGPMGPSRFLLSKPVIAAISGYAVAGGLELACWCDLRVADDTATFAVLCRRWGVPLIDGGTIRLQRQIGQSRALDMVLTGRNVTATEAYNIGLINRLVSSSSSVLSHAITLAEQLCSFPQHCLRADRASVHCEWSSSLSDGLQREFDRGHPIATSTATRQGSLAFQQGLGRRGVMVSQREFDGVSKLPAIQAVLFDIGGVVMSSPLEAILRFEKSHNITKGSIGRAIVLSGETGAFAALERGDLTMASDALFSRLSADIEQYGGGAKVNTRELMKCIEESLHIRPDMITLIKYIRKNYGIKTAAVTNNWKSSSVGDFGSSVITTGRDNQGVLLFDAIVESYKEGIRKPDPRLVLLAAARLDVLPCQCVFLDDLGVNLKGAKDAGIGWTIQVKTNYHDAILALERLLQSQNGKSNL